MMVRNSLRTVVCYILIAAITLLDVYVTRESHNALASPMSAKNVQSDVKFLALLR